MQVTRTALGRAGTLTRLCSLTLAAAACGGDLASPPSTVVVPIDSAISYPLPTAQVTIALSRELGDQPVPVGFLTSIKAVLKDASGSTLTGHPVQWQSSDETVAKFVYQGAVLGILQAVGAGTMHVSATAEGDTARLDVTVVAPTPSPSSVVVDTFTVIEFQYPSAPGQWYYAPRVHLKETSGTHGADVIAMSFTISTLPPAPSCLVSRHLDPGASVELFQEIYGDFQVTIDQPSGRAGPGMATAFIQVSNGDGSYSTLTVQGPIVPGALPTTYTGGRPVTSISCN